MMHFDDATLENLFLTPAPATPEAKRPRCDDVSPASTCDDESRVTKAVLPSLTKAVEPSLTKAKVGAKRSRRDESATTTPSGSDDDSDGYDSLTVKQLEAIMVRMVTKRDKMVKAFDL